MLINYYQIRVCEVERSLKNEYSQSFLQLLFPNFVNSTNPYKQGGDVDL